VSDASRSGAAATCVAPPVPDRPTMHSQHGIRKPTTYTDGTVSYGLFTSTGEPQHHNEALGDTRWKLAMESEMNALKKNEAWHLVSRKPEINVINCK
jgi:hypothetical protein